MSEPRTCGGCGKPTPDGNNDCSWQCAVDLAQRRGGRVVAPNNLPIVCIRADNNAMLEHEHADHPDYKFPVTAEYVGAPAELPEWDCSLRPQSHAFIYTDGHVAVTLYECCYTIWSVATGLSFGGFADRKEWRLTEESLVKIRDAAGAPTAATASPSTS
jgi:predicted nucleic acid-binding Zn ribbon protein